MSKNPPHEVPSLTGFDNGSLKVVVFGGKRLRIITCPVKENKAYITSKIFIGFKTDDVGAVKIRSRRPPFRVEWFQAILWRQGMADAMPWGNERDELPPLTQTENATFIERIIAAAKAKDKKPIGDWQLALIIIMLGLVLVGVALNLFGVHFGVSTATHTVTTLKPTPTPISVP